MSPLRRGTQVLAATLSILALNASAYATTVTIQPSDQDASILQDSPNRPKGSGTNNTRFHVRTSTSTPRVRRGLVQFNLNTIPQFATITSAVLSLYQGSSPTNAAHTNNVFRINDPWLQSSVKWNTQPTIQGVATASNATVGAVRNVFYNWTVTPDVQLWINSPTSNHGWMVKDAAENGTDEIIAYISAEESAGPDLQHRPTLVVDYTAPPCSTNADCAENPDNLCTTNERCQAGHCAVDPVVCDDNNACTDNICDPQQGCLFPVGECNDGFDCTIDSCDPQGGCINTPVNSACTNEGCKVATCVADPDNPNVDPTSGCVTTQVNPDNTPCTADANQCTSDVCTSGQCTHPNAPLNTACAADGNPCTDDVCDGAGACGVNNSAPCTDSNACTVGDQCSGGSCASGTPVVCTALGQCYNAGTCDTQTGMCSNPPKNAGAGCDDGTACTSPDQCDGAGACVGGNPVVCTPLDQCHNAGTCDAQSGLCSNPPKPDNSACNDGNACTQTDVCTGGTCGGTSVVCTPLDQCHNAGTCDTQSGQCSNPPKPDNSACNDGNACTQTDQCTGGTCIGGNDIVCTAQGQCYDVGTCDTQTGFCSNPPKSNTSGCNDGNLCTQTDTCDGAGTCVGGNPVVCTPLDQCHLAGTCDTQTGVCDDPVKNNGDPCDDGNTCTASDQCMGGTCIGDSGSCGNGMVECGEQCDDAAQNGNGSCTAQCQLVCPPTPQANCRKPVVAKKAKTVLKDKTPDKKDALIWKWLKGTATTLGDYGAPLTTTGYAICVYDASANSQPRLFAFAPPGGTCSGKPCWKTIKNGFKYKDSKLLDPDGISGITLKAGVASSAKALVKGKGVNLGMPSLPLTTPVIVQLKKNDDPGVCWDAQFSNPEKNQSDQFKSAAD